MCIRDRYCCNELLLSKAFEHIPISADPSSALLIPTLDPPPVSYTHLGRDITPESILDVYEKTKNPEKEVSWIGLKEE